VHWCNAVLDMAQ